VKREKNTKQQIGELHKSVTTNYEVFQVQSLDIFSFVFKVDLYLICNIAFSQGLTKHAFVSISI